MSYIDDLRRRVETAEQGFGLIGEQHGRYSERLISLMDALEESQRRKQAEMERLAHENEQVRAMLHALLLAVEEGSRDRLSDAMRLLDVRASGLVGRAAAVAVAAPAEPSVRDQVDDALADEPAEDIAAELPADDIVADAPAEDMAAAYAAAVQPVDDAVVDQPAEDAVAGGLFEDIPTEEVAVEQLADDAVVDE